MRPVSDRLLAALRGSHRMTARARVLTSFQTGVDPDGVVIAVHAGQVTARAGADVRATLDLVTDGTGWSTDPDQLLTPYGNELFVERGVVFGGGSVEWVSQGYFRIYRPEQDDAPDGQLRITARDRMSALIDGRLEAPRQFPASATVGDVFDDLVGEIYPDHTIEADDDVLGDSLGRAVVAERDRYAFLRDLATARGKVTWWDHRGILRLAAPPNPAQPVWDVTHGASGVLVRLARRLNRDRIYNAVVALGEGADSITPVRGVARDNNPHSPTYYHGPFGKVPRFFYSQFLTTSAQARQAAAGILTQAIGLPHEIRFETIPNPGLEVLDPIRITHDDAAAAKVHVLDELTTPLTAAGAMAGATRQQTALQLELV